MLFRFHFPHLLKKEIELNDTGVTSARWQNKSFQHSCPHRKINLNNYPCAKIPSQELRVPGERVQLLGQAQK